MLSIDKSLEARARRSLGSSNDEILRMVVRALDARGISGGRLIDAGCGGGDLWRELHGRFASYCGVDAVRYERFPCYLEFQYVDLDGAQPPLEESSADLVAAVEVIEHLENPWAFMRMLTRLAKPGGWIVITTPNQLSALSLVTLLVKRRFSAFQDVHYPAHRTALLESDLRRIASDCGLEQVVVEYSQHGRLPLVSRHFPATIARAFPRILSDNLMLIGRKPLV